MPTAQDYYKLAARCVIWAKEAENDRAREAFKNLAQFWEKEARRTESIEANPANAEVASAIEAALARD
jgi:hypothetical protein